MFQFFLCGHNGNCTAALAPVSGGCAAAIEIRERRFVHTKANGSRIEDYVVAIARHPAGEHAISVWIGKSGYAGGTILATSTGFFLKSPHAAAIG